MVPYSIRERTIFNPSALGSALPPVALNDPLVDTGAGTLVIEVAYLVY
jgi:hypothetical protein